MKTKIFLFLLFIIAVFAGNRAECIMLKFDKSLFYQVLKSGRVGEINTQLAKLDTTTLNEKNAYEGTLLMKKAGLVQQPQEKILYFKSGRAKLEAAIAADQDNAEYHFLRLLIQEHAPEIVRYNGQLAEDRLFVGEHFDKLSPAVQKTVVDYCKTSAVLNREDLKR